MLFSDKCSFVKHLIVSVAPVQVKNRLDPGYDAGRLSGGYRDVNVNLRLVSPLAARLGADTHVCEVCLHQVNGILV